VLHVCDYVTVTVYADDVMKRFKATSGAKNIYTMKKIDIQVHRDSTTL